MPNKIMPTIIIILIVITMLFGNKKVGVFSVFAKQISVYKNAKTNKVSIWDLICFIFLPIALAVLIVLEFNNAITTQLASVLTTVFAFVFTVLFGFAAILVGKLDSSNKIEKQVVSETFISIMTSNLMSLISAVLSIIIIVIDSTESFISLFLSVLLYSLSFMIIMLLLMISKRTLVIYCSNTTLDK